MSVYNFTFLGSSGIIPAVVINGWDDTMAKSGNERARDYQRREAEKRKLWSAEELDAYRAEKRAYAKAWREKNIDSRHEYERTYAKAARRAKAEAEGRQFGVLGRHYGTSEEEKASRKEAKRQKKLAYDKERYPLIADKKIQSARDFYWGDLEANRAKCREYYANHKEESFAHGRTRRARVRGADGTHTAEEVRTLRVLQNGVCLFCGSPLGDEAPHVDHWVPLSKGGTNGVENLALLHKQCNLKKHAKMPAAFGFPNDVRELRVATFDVIETQSTTPGK